MIWKNFSPNKSCWSRVFGFTKWSFGKKFGSYLFIACRILSFLMQHAPQIWYCRVVYPSGKTFVARTALIIVVCCNVLSKVPLNGPSIQSFPSFKTLSGTERRVSCFVLDVHGPHATHVVCRGVFLVGFRRHDWHWKIFAGSIEYRVVGLTLTIIRPVTCVRLQKEQSFFWVDMVNIAWRLLWRVCWVVVVMWGGWGI